MAQTWRIPDSDNLIDMTQIIKRLEWLDNERRNDKEKISLLEERVAQLQIDNTAMKTDTKQLQTDISAYSNVFSKIDQVDQSIAKTKIDLTRVIDSNFKTNRDKEAEIDNARKNANDSLNRMIIDIRKTIEPLTDMKKNIQNQAESGFKITRAIETLDQRITNLSQEKDDLARVQKVTEESRKQDTKRLTDMQNELTVYRKKNEEIRGQIELFSDSLKKYDQRLIEITTSDNERKLLIQSFFEKTNLADVDRQKEMQEWKNSMQEVLDKSASLTTQTQLIESTNRSVKRSQEALDEATQRFDRRTNEMTEMQRLMEEKFRQEWSVFKSDDQKRWANYMIEQDEIQSDYQRDSQQILDRLNALEDVSASTTDSANVRDEMYTAQLQELYTLIRTWLEKMGIK